MTSVHNLGNSGTVVAANDCHSGPMVAHQRHKWWATGGSHQCIAVGVSGQPTLAQRRPAPLMGHRWPMGGPLVAFRHWLTGGPPVVHWWLSLRWANVGWLDAPTVVRRWLPLLVHHMWCYRVDTIWDVDQLILLDYRFCLQSRQGIILVRLRASTKMIRQISLMSLTQRTYMYTHKARQCLCLSYSVNRNQAARLG